jgi:hypothetical protein
MNYYTTELLAAQRIADQRREADHARLARSGRPSNASVDSRSDLLRRLAGWVGQRGSWLRGIRRPLRPATGA